MRKINEKKWVFQRAEGFKRYNGEGYDESNWYDPKEMKNILDVLKNLVGKRIKVRLLKEVAATDHIMKGKLSAGDGMVKLIDTRIIDGEVDDEYTSHFAPNEIWSIEIIESDG